MVLLEPSDVAAALKIPVKTAREVMKKMPHQRIGKYLRVEEGALSLYIKERTRTLQPESIPPTRESVAKAARGPNDFRARPCITRPRKKKSAGRPT